MKSKLKITQQNTVRPKSYKYEDIECGFFTAFMEAAGRRLLFIKCYGTFATVEDPSESWYNDRFDGKWIKDPLPVEIDISYTEVF